MVLCVACGVREQSTREGVKKGYCCNRCPNHGPWCTGATIYRKLKKLKKQAPPSKKTTGRAKLTGTITKLVKVTVKPGKAAPAVAAKVVLCVNCKIRPQSKRKGVKKGWCCNKCPDHGPWCSGEGVPCPTSAGSAVAAASSTAGGAKTSSKKRPAAAAEPSGPAAAVAVCPVASPIAESAKATKKRPAAASAAAPAVEGALCVNCHARPQSTRKGVRKGWCCNKCPTHGPWCTGKAGSSSASISAPAAASAAAPQPAPVVAAPAVAATA
mmetsp:Transcript_20885/g.38101  ORF Transcript_20885/g.38101 Transcript_20885/m.38101 type:complete len:269 (-) Transcript_20885:185-991(-)